jgi:DnaJ-class molecular chaperone
MDYYKVLGISQNATDKEIKRAFHELSFKYHPDKTKNCPESDQKMREINEAYETLKDANLRRQYDMRNSNPIQHIFSEIFRTDFRPDVRNEFRSEFQMPRHFTNTRQMPINIFDIINEMHSTEPIIFTSTMQEETVISPPAIEVKVSLTLEQAYKGHNEPIVIEREIKNGKQIQRESEVIYVTVPPGIDTGEIITISEKGSQYNGIKGDVKVIIQIKPNEVFERKGLNLICKHNITFKESITGFDFIINHPDGNSFKIKSTRGNIIQNLDEKMIKGKGVSRDGSTGDMIIVFRVSSPKSLTEEQLIALESVL